jgi:hypothetical protein
MTASFSSFEIGSSICESPPSFMEVKRSLDHLANHKAAGLDLLFNESLKHGGQALCQTLTTLFDGMWKLEQTPAI